MRSRNGHAVLAIWTRLFGHGHDGYAQDARHCSTRAQALATRMRTPGAPVLCNPHALTVVFDEPSTAIVMPNVTDTLLDDFATDYLP